MSTSHYSRSIQAVYDHVDKPVHSSLAHPRPESTDVGADTIKLQDKVLAPMPNTRRSSLPRLLSLLAGGVALLLLDGCAIAHYADSVTESVIIALVTMPTGGFLLAVAMAIADVDSDTDWMH